MPMSCACGADCGSRCGWYDDETFCANCGDEIAHCCVGCGIHDDEMCDCFWLDADPIEVIAARGQFAVDVIV